MSIFQRSSTVARARAQAEQRAVDRARERTLKRNRERLESPARARAAAAASARAAAREQERSFQNRLIENENLAAPPEEPSVEVYGEHETPDFQAFVSSWRVHAGPKQIEEGLDLLLERMRERFGEHAKAAFLTVTPPNGGGPSLKNFKLENMTSAVLLGHVLKAMNQSGRTNFQISELVFELTVIQKTIGGRKTAKDVVDSRRN